MKPANKPPQMPWMAIVEKLVELGWAPPVSAPEAAQNYLAVSAAADQHGQPESLVQCL